ncbi:DinB family protein [Streptomyces sp. DSM 42041]|uniref:DinB family protein n=1 Tax=Streptomyces hazeniae TaxID=3075538 RepID=A0ABU2NXR9_9ACTN|nr:DinB family protein [Streptomyces sp. DSM 42041]MDT0380762.1 DinB family protein [Streptomyces sp. DSM 42041]
MTSHTGVPADQEKADLRRYLQAAREAVLWKLEGLSEYDVRRPLTPTGTNLLGLVKHLAGVELGYFGETFGRPPEDPPPWLSDLSDPNQDMWAGLDETRDSVIALYHRAWAHTDATVAALPLDATGRVPWWPEDRAEVSLHRVLVHVIADSQRHAGQADILREQLDGAVGMRKGNDNMPPGDTDWWRDYRARLEATAQRAADRKH